MSGEQEAPPPLGILRKASLYAGDLHPEVTEMDLVQAFSIVAPVTYARVCRDSDSFKSLCYGYVNFFHLSDASRALASLNHTELKGKTMRLMWCQRDPLAIKNNIANLYVKNLVPTVTSAQLERMFSKYGIILSCKVAQDDNGKSRGFGFVQFDSENSAMAALDALHGTMFEGKQLYVCKFMKKSDRNGTFEETFRILCVKNLDMHISEDLLRETFSEHGKVCSIEIMKDNNGKSKGLGFVEFSSHEEAKNAMERLNGLQLGSKNLFVGRAWKNVQRRQNMHVYETTRNTNSNQPQNLKLYVKNLKECIDDRKLKELFFPYGKVTSAKVMCHDNGVSKGHGFVCFSCPEEARKALESLNGTTVQGLSLYVTLARRPEEPHSPFQRCQAPYAKQSIHASSWNILYPGYCPLYYSVPSLHPPISLSCISLSQSNQYRNYGSCSGGMFTCGMQNPEEKLSTCPMKSTTTYVSPQNDKKPECLTVCGTAEAPCTKSAIRWCPVRSLPQGMFQKNNGKMFCPHIENVETEDESNTTSVQTKMGNLDLLEVIDASCALAQHPQPVCHLPRAPSSGSILE